MDAYTECEVCGAGLSAGDAIGGIMSYSRGSYPVSFCQECVFSGKMDVWKAGFQKADFLMKDRKSSESSKFFKWWRRK